MLRKCSKVSNTQDALESSNLEQRFSENRSSGKKIQAKAIYKRRSLVGKYQKKNHTRRKCITLFL